MCKGADSIIADRLSKDSKNSEIFHKTEEYVNSFADEGLRTLFLAQKEIDRDVYEKWNK